MPAAAIRAHSGEARQAAAGRGRYELWGAKAGGICREMIDRWEVIGKAYVVWWWWQKEWCFDWLDRGRRAYPCEGVVIRADP